MLAATPPPTSSRASAENAAIACLENLGCGFSGGGSDENCAPVRLDDECQPVGRAPPNCLAPASDAPGAGAPASGAGGGAPKPDEPSADSGEDSGEVFGEVFGDSFGEGFGLTR